MVLPFFSILAEEIKKTCKLLHFVLLSPQSEKQFPIIRA